MTDAELIARLRSQIGDDVQHVYDHEALFRISADRIEQLLNLNEALVELMDDRDAKLAKAVEEAEKYQRAFAAQSRKLQAVLHIEGVRTTLAAVSETHKIKGESHDPL